MSPPREPNQAPPILRAQSVSAWREGERFLEQARHDAEALHRQAQQDAQEAREQARQQGYEQGRQEGLEDAARLALQMTAQRDAQLHSLAPRLVEAIDASVRKILGAIAPAELIEGVAREAMQAMHGTSQVTLRVPPGMADQLNERSACLERRRVIVVEDDALRNSMCFLETPMGIIELSPHAQWDRLLQAMHDAAGKAC